MRYCPSTLRFLVLLNFLAAVFAQEAANFSAWVVNQGSGVPVDNARVFLHRRPPEAQPLRSRESDTFGFATLTNVPPGEFTLHVEHPAYLPYQTNVTMLAGLSTNRTVKLIPIDGKTYFDIFFQVYCEATGAELVGARIVAEYWEPDGVLTGGPDRVFNQVAGLGGTATILGARDGFYKFTVSAPGWQPNVYVPPPSGFVVDGDKVRLIRTHFATAFLRPNRSPLTVTVKGFDPVKNEPNLPLKGMTINLTGIDLINDNMVLVPAVTALTGVDGSFTFRNLAPIRWKIEVSRLGYKPVEVIVATDFNGALSPVEIPVELEPTKVKVVVSSIYQTNSAVTGADIRLEGILNSGTEGISRKLEANTITNQQAFALFENLLPGRYWIYAEHETTLTGLPSNSGPLRGPNAFRVAYFPKETFAMPIEAQTEEVKIELDPVPARIRGRLYATDELGQLETTFFDPEPNRIFHFIAQNGINFIEHKLIKLLPPEHATIVTDSDEAGHYSLLIPPGIFGVQIPTMANYTGHNIEFGSLTENRPPVPSPWPYPDIWPYTSFEGGHHGAGLRFDSAQEYQLDFFMHAHYINLAGRVQTSGEPFGSQILSMARDGSNVQSLPYNYLRDTGAEVVATGAATYSTHLLNGNWYLLRRLRPGTYSIRLNSSEYQTAPVSVTIAPWQPPGIIPSVAPFTPTYFFPGISHGDGPRIDAEWKTKGTIGVNYFYWTTGDPPAYTGGSSARPQLFRQSTLPGRLFTFGFGGGIPSGAYAVWSRYDGDDWFSAAGTGSASFDAYDGGPRDNVNANNAPSDIESYTLDLHAYSIADQSMEIPNVTVQFPKSTRPAGGQVAHDDSPNPTGATHAQGQWFYSSAQVQTIDASIKLIEVKVLMQRAMVVAGKITSVAGPVANAAVVLRNRYGNPIARALSSADGSYRFQGLQPQPVYLDVSRRGFIPTRKRFDPPSVTNPDITGNLTMEIVPAPEIQTFTMNRFGLFLPGALKSGDASGFNVDNAKERLTATWKASGTAKSFSTTFDGYVRPDETQQPPELFQVSDKITEVWIVDRRAFTNAFVNERNQRAFSEVIPPAPLTYSATMNWLGEISRARKNGQPYYVVHQQFSQTRASTNVQQSGEFNLWELPSGVFSPRVVVITESGGVAVKDYELPAGDWSNLQGMNLPDWASGLLDVIGGAANAPRGELEIHGQSSGGWVKIGSVSPLAEARITLDPLDAKPADNANLIYKYVVGAEFPMSETAGQSKQLSFWPSSIGYKITGLSAEFELTGKDKKIALAVVRQNSFPDDEEERDKDFIPVAAEAEKTVDVDVNFKHSLKFGATQTVDADSLGNNTLAALSMVIEAQGLADVVVKVNLSRVGRNLPYVGQVLTGLSAVGGTLYGIFETTVGTKLALEFITTLPKPGTGGTTTSRVLPANWSFLGQATNSVKTEFKIILRIAAGLQLAFGNLYPGRNVAEGTILGQIGAPKNAGDTDGVFFTVDPINRNPLIQKIDGAISLVGRININLWALKLQKQFQVDGLVFSIDRTQTNTPAGIRALAAADRPRFELTPLFLTYTVFNPATSPPFRFAGANAKVVDNFYPGGAQAVSGGSSPIMAFTGTEPSTGEMTLLVSMRQGSQWQAPREIASAGGILSVAAAESPGGGWIVVWSEISAAEMGNPFPSARLKYSVSNSSGSQWSSPALLRTPNGANGAAIFDLKMVTAGQTALLVYSSTKDGPSGGSSTVHSSAWDGLDWTAQTTLLSSRTLTGYQLAGHGSGAALLGILETSGQLHFIRCNNTVWASPQVVRTNIASFAFALPNPSEALLATPTAEDRIDLARINLNTFVSAGWGAPITNALPQELLLHPLAQSGITNYLIAWTSGGDNNSIYHTLLNASGTALAPVMQSIGSSSGVHSHLSARDAGSGRAVILARLTTATNTSLNEFSVGLPAASDCNGNGVSDAVEIASGAALDCNGNGVPDSCDLASGVLQDRNQDGFPDDCLPAVADDCNANGLSDAYEISLGIGDFDGNGRLDACEGSIAIKSVPLDRTVRARFYRAPSLRLKSRTATALELEFQGALEQAEGLGGPWSPVP